MSAFFLAEIERELTRLADDIEDWDEYNLREGRDRLRTLASMVAVECERQKMKDGK